MKITSILTASAMLLGSLMAAPQVLAMASPSQAHAAANTGILPILDDQGRELILNGTNGGSAKHTYLRRFFENQDDLNFYAQSLGYNTFRYLIFWDHVMPQRGVINQAYLDDIEARLQWFTDNGMHVVLDMHQDNWGEQCGGNGAPAWATQGTTEPAPGAPWWIMAASPCVVDSSNAFFRNHGDIQAEYVKAWKAVAERFKDHPAVLGYDLMNEPTQTDAIVDQMVNEMLSKDDTGLLNFAVVGTIWVDGKPQNMFSDLIKSKVRGLADSVGIAVPEVYVNKITEVLISRNKGDWGKLNAVKEFEGGMLSDLYQKTINAIRTVDNKNYIFVEPFSVSVNNGMPTYLRRLNDPSTEGRRLGYIPHMYPRDLHEGLGYKETDFAVLDRWEYNQRKFVTDNNMAWLLGEFGHSNWAVDGVQYLKDAVLMLERNHLGWQYWDSTPCAWGPLDCDNRSDLPNAQALVNIYPGAVAGGIDYYHFDRDRQTFTLSYHNTLATGTTEIHIPPRYAVNGFAVESSDPAGSWSYSYDAARAVLSINHNPSSYSHNIVIHPQAQAVLAYREFKNNKTGKCLDFPGILPSAGKAAILNSCAGKSWQRWAYDGAAKLVRSLQNPNMCLSHGNAANAKNGGKVTIQACSTSQDVQWNLVDGVLRNVYNSNIVLDAFGDKDGAEAGQWAFHGGANQRWSFGAY